MDILQGAKEHIQMLKQKKRTELKVYRRYRKLFKNSKTSVSPVLLLSKQKKLTPKYSFVLKVTQNNVFCTLLNYKNKKILLNTSSGKEKLNVSRKTITFGAKNIIICFLKKIKRKIVGSGVLVNITAPLRIKVFFLRLLKIHIKKCFLLINTNHKKCFNGCKPPKKKRKKQRGLRVFK